MERKDTIASQFRERVRCLIDILDKLEERGQQIGKHDDLKYRVIHYKHNPMEMEIEAHQTELKKLERENERLRARCELLESGGLAVTGGDQLESLSQAIDECKKREEKLLDSFRRTSREYREVCYLLTGYRIEVLKDRIYRLSNMYAESEEDKLLFEITSDETIQLLQTEYSDRLHEYISTYLESSDSVPAFLAAITLDLFKTLTQMAPMSVCMSTTIQPNPEYKPQRG